MSDGPDFVCGERPPFVQTLALKLFCNQQPKPPKNERKMIPFFCSTMVPKLSEDLSDEELRELYFGN